MDFPPDDDDLYELPDEPRPFWTRRRILLTLIAIVIVVTLLAYSFSGLFYPPPPIPTPTLIPGSLM